ncbi:PspC domain-containing protein [Nocardioides sp. SR21]|uniref:PspC domain-containing protein n=1 Tax=Nocardioides sp. SR21 TaxID=2919501 RepID=UPI001FA9B850|nr:PspC domain-containing protein [Nocardioides sp. SR21]
MTTTPPEAPLGPPPPDPSGDHGPRVDRDQVRDLGRLRRSRADRKVAGVAGGLGRHLDIDPLVLRVAFVVLVFFGGAGLILYGACWLLVPEDGSDRAPIHLDERTRSIVLVVVGGLAALAMIGDSWGGGWFPWPLAVVALIALWLLTRNNPPSGAAPSAPAPGAEVPPTSSYIPPASSYIPPTSTYVPPQPYHTEPVAPFQSYVRPPNPRKKGPILFWFTLALIALSVGLLGIIDLAGASIADSAYPALAVGISGVMLLLGAFFGRAGGIIALGLIASLGLAGATAVDQIDAKTVTSRPLTAFEVQSSYSLDVGEQRIDLSEVSDLDNLDGRTIAVTGDVGRIEITLPDGLAARINASVDGPGNINLFGEEDGGVDIDQQRIVGSAGEPTITLDVTLDVGQIEVKNR